MDTMVTRGYQCHRMSSVVGYSGYSWLFHVIIQVAPEFIFLATYQRSVLLLGEGILTDNYQSLKDINLYSNHYESFRNLTVSATILTTTLAIGYHQPFLIT